MPNLALDSAAVVSSKDVRLKGLKKSIEKYNAEATDIYAPIGDGDLNAYKRLLGAVEKDAKNAAKPMAKATRGPDKEIHDNIQGLLADIKVKTRALEKLVTKYITVKDGLNDPKIKKGLKFLLLFKANKIQALVFQHPSKNILLETVKSENKDSQVGGATVFSGICTSKAKSMSLVLDSGDQDIETLRSFAAQKPKWNAFEGFKNAQALFTEVQVYAPDSREGQAIVQAMGEEDGIDEGNGDLDEVQATVDVPEQPAPVDTSKQEEYEKKRKQVLTLLGALKDNYGSTLAGRKALEAMATKARFMSAYAEDEDFEKAIDAGTTMIEYGQQVSTYMKVRLQLTDQLENAQKVDEVNAIIESRLGAIDTEASVPKLQTLVSDIQALMKSRREAVEKELIKLHEQVILGKLDLQRDPNEARGTITKYLKTWDIVEAEREVNLFAEQIKRAKTLSLIEIDSVEELHKKTKLQNSQYARNTQLSKAIATRLIGSDGKIVMDRGVFDVLGSDDNLLDLMDEIKAGNHDDLPQSEHALAILQKLKTHEDLRNKLESITKPDEQDSAAANLIRSTLGLDSDAEVTDVHARQAALSGLLFQVRQGSVGSCFATATACMVQRLHPEKFLDDISNLFTNGKLTRTVGVPPDQKTIEVPLNPTIAKGNLEKKAEVKRKDMTIHLAPDFVASMDALGIPADEQKRAMELAAREIRCEQALSDAFKNFPDRWFVAPNTRDVVETAILEELRANTSMTIEDALQAVVNEKDIYFTSDTTRPLGGGNAHLAQARLNAALAECAKFDDEDGTDMLKPEELLERMAKAKFSDPELATKLKGSKDAFLGQQDNLLLRTWEYSCATMVEKMPGSGSNHARMSRGVYSASWDFLEDFINNTMPPKIGINKNQLQVLRAKLLNDFKPLFDSKTETRYDPTAKTRKEKLSVDGHSSGGGYCLYVGDKQIETADQYKDAIIALLNEAKSNLGSPVDGWPEFAELPGLIDILAQELVKDSFHDQIAIETCGSSDPNILNNMATPWTFQGGGNTDNMLQIYYDSPTPFVKKLSPPGTDDAEKLAGFLFDTFDHMKVAQTLDPYKPVEESSIPVRAAGNHAFNLIPGSPGLFAMLNSRDPKQSLVDFKTNEQAKNAKRNNHALDLNAPPDGMLKKLIDKALFIFGSSPPAGVIDQINDKFALEAGDTISVTDANTIIGDEIRDYLAVHYTSINSLERNEWVDKALSRGTATLLSDIVPQEEFEPKIIECLLKLGIESTHHDTIKDEVMKALTDDSYEKDALATKLVGLIKTELGKLRVDGITGLPEDDRVKADVLTSALTQPLGLVFADANWGDGDHRVFMSMVVNPRTGEMELWQMNHDGTAPSKMSTEDWIKNSQWQVFADTQQYDGMTGDSEWERIRSEGRTKLEQCVKKSVGNITTMQNTLEIADNDFAMGEKDKAKVAIETTLETLTTAALQLAGKRDDAVEKVNTVTELIKTVDTPEKATAVIQTESLKVAIESISTPEQIAPIVSRFKPLCDILKDASSYDDISTSVDVETLLSA